MMLQIGFVAVINIAVWLLLACVEGVVS